MIVTHILSNSKIFGNVFAISCFPQRHPLNLLNTKLSIKQDCWRGPLPWWPQKPPKVELQTVPRACVYYVRGGFHPENCTGCFSGPDRVNSSSCALPAGEACIYVCAWVRECTFVRVSVSISNLGYSVSMPALVNACVCRLKSVCVCTGCGADGAGHTESLAQVITHCRPFTNKKEKKMSGWMNDARDSHSDKARERESERT